MKSFKLLLLIAGLLAAPFALQAQAEAPASDEATTLVVVSIQGDVANPDTGVSLKVGDIITAAQKVNVPKGAKLVLRKIDKTFLVIEGPADTEVSISANGNLEVVVNGGNVVVSGGDAAKGGEVTVTANDVKATIKAGTTAAVKVAENGSVDVAAVSGEAVAVTAGGQTTQAAVGTNVNLAKDASGNVTATSSNLTASQTIAINSSVETATEAAKEAQETVVVPEAAVSDDNTVPTNPDAVISGEEA